MAQTCPVSGSSPSTSACPASHQRIFHPKVPRRAASHSRKTIPDLRKPQRDALLYLPPLLSLLPSQLPPPPSSEPFSFKEPKVGYTTGRLPEIDAASVALHGALHRFRPTTEDYATELYTDAFNWDELQLPEEIEREWYALFRPFQGREGAQCQDGRYIVAFRSVRAADSPSRDLYEADRAAHEEAVKVRSYSCRFSFS
jgi:hypothetical protein